MESLLLVPVGTSDHFLLSLIKQRANPSLLSKEGDSLHLGNCHGQTALSPFSGLLITVLSPSIPTPTNNLFFLLTNEPITVVCFFVFGPMLHQRAQDLNYLASIFRAFGCGCPLLNLSHLLFSNKAQWGRVQTSSQENQSGSEWAENQSEQSTHTHTHTHTHYVSNLHTVP